MLDPSLCFSLKSWIAAVTNTGSNVLRINSKKSALELSFVLIKKPIKMEKNQNTTVML